MLVCKKVFLALRKMWKASSESEFAAKFFLCFSITFRWVGSVEIRISTGGNRVPLIPAVFSPSKKEKKRKTKESSHSEWKVYQRKVHCHGNKYSQWLRKNQWKEYLWNVAKWCVKKILMMRRKKCSENKLTFEICLIMKSNFWVGEKQFSGLQMEIRLGFAVISAFITPKLGITCYLIEA